VARSGIGSGSPPGCCSVVGSLAGNVSATARSWLPFVYSALRVRERHTILRTARARERRLDVGEIELDDLRVGRVLVGLVPEHVLLAVRLDERHAIG
jgi:hypothetical protein